MDNASAVSVAAGISPPSKVPPSSAAGPERSQGISPSARSGTLRRPTRQTPGILVSTSLGITADIDNSGAVPAPKPEPSVCPICYDDSQTAFSALSCDHTFCTGCWNAYITSKIREEGEHAIRCMAEGCGIIAPDQFVRAILGDDAATWERFNELLVRHFVGSNPNLKYCPYPSCTYTVSCPAAASRSALATIVPTVTCGVSPQHKFCFGCAIESDHRPVICGVAKMWLRKCRDDSETANWIKSNTKECSKCQSTIEKNGGCKYVSFDVLYTLSSRYSHVP